MTLTKMYFNRTRTFAMIGLVVSLCSGCIIHPLGGHHGHHGNYGHHGKHR